MLAHSEACLRALESPPQLRLTDFCTLCMIFSRSLTCRRSIRVSCLRQLWRKSSICRNNLLYLPLRRVSSIQLKYKEYHPSHGDISLPRLEQPALSLLPLPNILCHRHSNVPYLPLCCTSSQLYFRFWRHIMGHSRRNGNPRSTTMPRPLHCRQLHSCLARVPLRHLRSEHGKT